MPTLIEKFLSRALNRLGNGIMKIHSLAIKIRLNLINTKLESSPEQQYILANWSTFGDRLNLQATPYPRLKVLVFSKELESCHLFSKQRLAFGILYQTSKALRITILIIKKLLRKHADKIGIVRIFSRDFMY